MHQYSRETQLEIPTLSQRSQYEKAGVPYFLGNYAPPSTAVRASFNSRVIRCFNEVSYYSPKLLSFILGLTQSLLGLVIPNPQMAWACLIIARLSIYNPLYFFLENPFCN